MITAEKFLIEFLEKKGVHSLSSDEMTERYAIEFANMHVTEALKQASEKAQAFQMCKDTDPIIISKESILTAYPLELIK